MFQWLSDVVEGLTQGFEEGCEIMEPVMNALGLPPPKEVMVTVLKQLFGK